MATLHLMIGLPCSGKTTYARELEKAHNALLLTTDVWHIKLFGHDAQDHQAHDLRHRHIEEIIWSVAERVLALGRDVILDFGCWAKEEREAYRQKAKALGVDFKLHYMKVETDELFRRLEARNQIHSDQTFVIPKEDMEKYVKIFQPPSNEELKSLSMRIPGTLCGERRINQ